MIMRFVTPKGENVILSISKIMLISEEKKGVTVIMDDGTPISISDSFEKISQRLRNRDILFKTNED